jgi:inner membrane protein
VDNVTHSIAGLMLAECVVRLRAYRAGVEPSARFRSVAALSSMVAANMPDFDLLYTGTGGDQLAYMLHHRGYTHTVIIGILGAVLLWGASLLVWRWRARSATPRADARWLFGLLLVSTLGHLALDWTNSYGVHLFWPFDNRWSYGDAVFIVEPWFWVIAVPMLVASSTSRIARGLLSLVLLIGLVLAWRVDLVSLGAASLLTVGAAGSIALARALRPGPRAAVAVVGWIGVTLIMTAGSRVARQAAVRSARAADPAAELLDVVVSPLPANAVCLSVITVERSDSTYRVVTSRVSAAPRITAAGKCGARGARGPLFRASTRPSTPAVQWDGEWTAPDAELGTLASESCRALAALRFIRVPVWSAASDSAVALGDARYGGGSGRGFSDVLVPRESRACPEDVPPWTPPRADLLGIVRSRELGSDGAPVIGT